MLEKETIGESDLQYKNITARKAFEELPMQELHTASIYRKGVSETNREFKERIISRLENLGVFGTYVNKNTGWNIRFNSNDAKSVLGHSPREGKTALLQKVPQMIKNGIYLETTPKNQQGLSTDVFASRANIDGTDYAIVYGVRNDGNGRRYYDHNLVDVIKVNEISSGARPSGLTAAYETTPHVAPETLSDVLIKHLS